MVVVSLIIRGSVLNKEGEVSVIYFLKAPVVAFGR